MGEFIFSVDFVVEIESVANREAQMPLILDRPFLATSNAFTNYQNGVMKLSFENVAVDFNIFNLQICYFL